EIKELKQHVKDMEIELPRDLKEIPTKLETFTFTISSFTSQVAELKNIQWKLPIEFLNFPSQVSSVQEKLKILDSFPSLLHKVTNTLNRFATMVENASGATTMNVSSAGKATASPVEGEKNTKDADTNLKDELVDLLGKNVVTQEDGSDEVISNLKVGDLHSVEWREVIQACPDKSEKGWKLFMICGTETEEGLWLELQFSLADNSKLKVVLYVNKSSSFGQKDLVFVKSLADDTKVSIPGVERPWLSKAEGFILPNHDTDDQMNSVINCLTAKSTWDDLIPYKALMNELVNDDIKLSKLEINTGFINGLPKKWLSFCQSLRNTNNMKDSELASLFGKLKYEENLIDSIYKTEKNKSLVSTTPLSTDFFSSSIVQDFQDSPDDEEDTRSSHEYLNDLEEEYQARALLSKSKTSRKNKPELRPTKDFKAKYNKVKAKLALLSSSASASKASMVKNKGLIVEAYEWDEEEVSSDDNEMVEVKVLMALAEENDAVSKEGVRNGFILPNHNTGRVLLAKSQRNTIGPSVAITDFSVTIYDLADESSVGITLLPPLKNLDGVEPISGPKTIKSILMSKSTFKAEALKGIIINKPSSATAKGNKSSLASKVHSAPVGKLKSVKIEDDPSLAIV
ncbi:hypothetical protein Tco_1064428, partial [Tanacetum coccineum]